LSPTFLPPLCLSKPLSFLEPSVTATHPSRPQKCHCDYALNHFLKAMPSPVPCIAHGFPQIQWGQGPWAVISLRSLMGSTVVETWSRCFRNTGGLKEPRWEKVGKGMQHL
jgi:hypothetical protein